MGEMGLSNSTLLEYCVFLLSTHLAVGVGALPSVLDLLAYHCEPNQKWRRLSPSLGLANPSKVYYPTKWVPVAGMSLQ